MHTLRSTIGIVWVLFWVGWLASAFSAKTGHTSWRRFPIGGVTLICVLIMERVLRTGSLVVASPVVGGIGAAVFVSGLALAVWARVYLGRNWGMPMTQKDDPELVTSGPYRFVRHPIYSGLVLGVLGTALATNVIGIAIAALVLAYFYYAATQEEKFLTASFPSAYPEYMADTKRLVPFVL